MQHSSNNYAVIVGLGATGLACANYLAKQNIPFVITDSRANPPLLKACQQQFPEINLALGSLSVELINQAQQLIVSPGVSIKTPAIAKRRNQQIKPIGDIELFAQAVTKPVIAITGSNGKSTVTTLLGEMINAAGYKACVCGNIGKPVLSVLDEDCDFYVLELSSFQLETTHSLNTVAAVILNICEDHMDRYNNLAEYTQAKQRIYQHCQQAIVNADEKNTWQSVSFVKPPVSFSEQTPSNNNFGLINQNGIAYLAKGQQLLLSAEEIVLKGTHRLTNALAAMALGDAVGLSMDVMLSTVKNFRGLAHRCELVREFNGVTWINDSKGTNVGATLAALKSLGATGQGKIVLIAGGDAKQADLLPLQPAIERYVSQLIVMGRDASLFEQAFKTVVPISKVDSLPQAVQFAASHAKSGDCVLLSPACASFDMFRNFEHRGDVFMQAVDAL